MNQIMNVFGEECDPICDFQNCYHTFSIHGHGSHQSEYNCVYTHPTNSALGVSKEVLSQWLCKFNTNPLLTRT